MAHGKDALPTLDRATVGINTAESVETRQHLISLIQEEVPNFAELIEKAKTLKNDGVAHFTKEVIELLSDKNLKIGNWKPNIASLLFPPVNLTNRKQLMSFVHSPIDIELLSIGSGHVSVAPPLNPNIYEVLRKNYKSKLYLAKLANVDISVWYKYEAAKVIPSANTWGLLLLTAGIHPVYQLAFRDDAEKFKQSEFSQLLTEHCMVRYASTGSADNNDLRTLTYSASDVVSYNKEETENVSSDRIINQIKSAGVSLEPVYKQLGLKNGEKFTGSLNKKDFKDLTETIKKLVKDNLSKFPSASYDHNITWERAILMGILEADLSPELLEDFHNYTRNVEIANRLYVESPNNPNVYTALKNMLISPESITSFYRMVNVDIGMWVRLEAGTRNLSTSLWSTILLVLNLHPFYKLKVRKDIANNVAGKIFVASHKVVVKEDKPENQNLVPQAFSLLK
ncbi:MULTISPECIES: hypothetical protein [Acinetobacter]|uniref:Uncharacterized protein n=1 Tax=Acinetobacter indicus TaxID=756892 RepID=A0A6C0Y6R3_9GAMM|nr:MULTISPECIES: hypothetical protein [Acinetobacter]QIC71799.1 hypothetical protein FSC09_15515 [Acinetobacter indicus]QKQ71707.1 hypothetical protein E5Y90_15875 [Acinetobacter sp. 10FS3-1]